VKGKNRGGAWRAHRRQGNSKICRQGEVTGQPRKERQGEEGRGLSGHSKKGPAAPRRKGLPESAQGTPMTERTSKGHRFNRGRESE